MQRSRRKQFNAINAPSLARWIVITAFLALTGLVYVYLNVQLHTLGERKKALENEVVRLRSESNLANGQIAALTSHPALQRRLKEGYLRMIPIADTHIVRVTVPLAVPRQDDIQPFKNLQAGR